MRNRRTTHAAFFALSVIRKIRKLWATRRQDPDLPVIFCVNALPSRPPPAAADLSLVCSLRDMVVDNSLDFQG